MAYRQRRKHGQFVHRQKNGGLRERRKNSKNCHRLGVRPRWQICSSPGVGGKGLSFQECDAWFEYNQKFDVGTLRDALIGDVR